MSLTFEIYILVLLVVTYLYILYKYIKSIKGLYTITMVKNINKSDLKKCLPSYINML